MNSIKKLVKKNLLSIISLIIATVALFSDFNNSRNERIRFENLNEQQENIKYQMKVDKILRDVNDDSFQYIVANSILYKNNNRDEYGDSLNQYLNFIGQIPDEFISESHLLLLMKSLYYYLREKNDSSSYYVQKAYNKVTTNPDLNSFYIFLCLQKNDTLQARKLINETIGLYDIRLKRNIVEPRYLALRSIFQFYNGSFEESLVDLWKFISVMPDTVYINIDNFIPYKYILEDCPLLAMRETKKGSKCFLSILSRNSTIRYTNGLGQESYSKASELCELQLKIYLRLLKTEKIKIKKSKMHFDVSRICYFLGRKEDSKFHMEESKKYHPNRKVLEGMSFMVMDDLGITNESGIINFEDGLLGEFNIENCLTDIFLN